MIVNLTPHTVRIVDSQDEIIREYASEGTARVKTDTRVVGEVDGVVIRCTVLGAVEGLPDPDNGITIYIVSMVVAQAAKDRKDLVAPDTGPTALRYQDGPQKGQIIGVRGFTVY